MSKTDFSKPGVEISTTDIPVENGVKKTKTPRQYDAILKGALALQLHHRVALKKRLQTSIEEEVEAAKTRAQEAEKIAES